MNARLKRLARITLKSLAISAVALSAALFLLLAALYPWSYSRGRGFGIQWEERRSNENSLYTIGLHTGRGLVRYHFSRYVIRSSDDLKRASTQPAMPLHFTAQDPDPREEEPSWVFMPEFDANYLEHKTHPSLFYRMGFGYNFIHYPDGSNGDDSTELVMPTWSALIVLAVGPVLWIARRRAMRARVGLCRRCRYDLRAHTSGEKCPECGTEVPAKAKA